MIVINIPALFIVILIGESPKSLLSSLVMLMFYSTKLLSLVNAFFLWKTPPTQNCFTFSIQHDSPKKKKSCDRNHTVLKISNQHANLVMSFCSMTFIHMADDGQELMMSQVLITCTKIQCNPIMSAFRNSWTVWSLQEHLGASSLKWVK